MPVATKFLIDKKFHYESGYRLGYVSAGKVNIAVHYVIKLDRVSVHRAINFFQSVTVTLVF